SVARVDADTAAPAERAARNLEAVRAPAPFVAAKAGEFHLLLRFLARDEVDREIGGAGAHPDVIVAGRQLDHAAERERGRLLAELGHQVVLRPDVEVADVVGGPVLVDAGIAIDEGAEGRVGDKDRTDGAVDARVDPERAKDLAPPLDADPERAGKVGNVRVALHKVGAAAVAATRPL